MGLTVRHWQCRPTVMRTHGIGSAAAVMASSLLLKISIGLGCFEHIPAKLQLESKLKDCNKTAISSDLRPNMSFRGNWRSQRCQANHQKLAKNRRSPETMPNDVRKSRHRPCNTYSHDSCVVCKPPVPQPCSKLVLCWAKGQSPE